MRRDRAPRSMMAAWFAVVALIGAGSPAAAAQEPPVVGQPNIVVLMVDDLPQRPAGRLFRRMPNINEVFLAGGQKWTNMYANDPLCCPGRASFLTGLWSRHHGVISNDPSVFRPEETVATALQEQGYWTAITGKYMNRMDNVADKTPPGWDRVAISPGGYWTDWWVDGTMEVHRDRSLPADYHTDVMREEAIDALRSAPAFSPVFMFLTAFAPHADQNIFDGPAVAPRHVGHPSCGDVGRYKSPAYAEADVSDKPAWVRALSTQRLNPNGWPLTKVCRSLIAVDEMFGAVVEELRAQGRSENTLFVLVADNGIGWGDHRLIHKARPYATHMPLWVRWDSYLQIAPSKVSAHASMVDLAPTIVAAAGGSLGPYPTGEDQPDGVSLLPTMATGVAPERDALLEEHEGWSAVRTTDGRWQYVEYDTGERELYDLTIDPWRMQNVAGAAEYAEVQSMLATRLAAFP